MKTRTLLELLALCCTITLFPSILKAQSADPVNVSFTVRDIDSGSPVAEANVFAFDENNKLVFEGFTDDIIGVFTVSTPLRPGQMIRVIIQKSGYKVFMENFEIKDPARQENNFEVKLIPKGHSVPEEPKNNIDRNHFNDPKANRNDFDTPLSGHVYDRRSVRKDKNIPLDGVRIDLLVDSRLIKNIGRTDKSGYFIIYHDFKPGKDVVLYLDKTPEYLLNEYHYTYQENVANLKIPLTRDPKIEPEWYCWGASILFAGSAVVFKIRSDNLFDDYEDPARFDTYNAWNDTYLKANFANNAFIGSAISSGVSLGLGFLVKYVFKKRVERADIRNSLKPKDNPFYSFLITPEGNSLKLAYRF